MLKAGLDLRHPRIVSLSPSAITGQPPPAPGPALPLAPRTRAGGGSGAKWGGTGGARLVLGADGRKGDISGAIVRPHYSS